MDTMLKRELGAKQTAELVGHSVDMVNAYERIVRDQNIKEAWNRVVSFPRSPQGHHTEEKEEDPESPVIIGFQGLNIHSEGETLSPLRSGPLKCVRPLDAPRLSTPHPRYLVSPILPFFYARKRSPLGSYFVHSEGETRTLDTAGMNRVL